MGAGDQNLYEMRVDLGLLEENHICGAGRKHDQAVMVKQALVKKN
jgi:hypothetical protein